MFKKKTNLPRRRVATSGQTNEPAASSVFRRNQTLNSYRGQSLDESSARRRTHELNKLRRRIAASLVVVAVLAGFTVFILWQFTSSVVVAARINGKAVDFGSRAKAYEAAANRYYAENPFERLRFLQRTDELMKVLKSAAPEISKLISLDPSGLPSTLTLNVELRQPVAAWSQDSKDFYVDGDGKSF
ncbi:MAG: hypothetical protein LBH36_03000, partial [Candidatus Nomurabacteria bacterium]|nr:hypothetical protein [Candidatus Nomurabacteria bacterium]